MNLHAQIPNWFQFFWAALWTSFAEKIDPIWNEPVNTGNAGAIARRSVLSTPNFNNLDAVTLSRFALIAGEGARAPSISVSLSAHATSWARPLTRIEANFECGG